MSKSDKPDIIEIRGARVHNLKNISLDIPRNKFIVVTGLSGSGKSSLAFDTLYAEGQRRYVESLSSYARQFLGAMNKPEVDQINGIPPAIAIEQRVTSKSPRSTVGTSTEIYDYLKLLFARVGDTYSPVSNTKVKCHSVNDVVSFIANMKNGTKVIIVSPYKIPEGITPEDVISILLKEGYTRAVEDGDIINLKDLDPEKNSDNIDIVIDRVKSSTGEESKNRVADSVQTAFNESEGKCIIIAYTEDGTVTETFSNVFEADGIIFEEPNPHMFSFNNPLGACKKCEGYGKVIGIDEDLVIPNKALSVYQDAIVCWKGEKMKEWKEHLILNAESCDFPVHRPYYELTPEQKDMLWEGTSSFEGINSFFDYLEEKKYKIQHRVMLSRYRGKTTCPDCKGTRLKKEAGYVKIDGYSIQQLVNKPISELREIFNNLELNKYKKELSKRILIEITNRINFLSDVGLGYLTLNRLSSTLSGGESQRISLVSALGSSLVGSIYILDEPSIGLHPRDTNRLIKSLKQLQETGNTVLVVEHEEEMIRAADQIIDIGPDAGRFGGEVVFQGSIDELINADNSYTAKYLTNKMMVEKPEKRRSWSKSITVSGARENNLKNITTKIPLGVITTVTGVSGSGKSTLIKDIFYNAIAKRLMGVGTRPGEHDDISGDTSVITSVEMIDQNPIGKSSRSNPVTYIKVYDDIRSLFSAQKAAKLAGLKPSSFSFNVAGGRCEDCKGEGVIHVEMQFMADVTLKCDSCKGKRFKENILEVKYRNKNIDDILNMSVSEAIEFFKMDDKTAAKKVVQKLMPLYDVGLGYVKLGQSSSTLSGGESQRVKLASFLKKDNSKEKIMFIFDEPTTGLHFHDVKKLLEAFNALVAKGHTIVIIEHNMEVIKSADWVIDLGPEGGDKGGNIVFEGVPEDLITSEGSYTGKFLKEKL
ncbi:MAG: excinuclease ABC subunit UvrA [Bacteroidales bacterium]|jgi:excinuclease ABC subunit A|nr:excinuclease ABC subunit UvrA [Bacteroidales bacterium]